MMCSTMQPETETDTETVTCEMKISSVLISVSEGKSWLAKADRASCKSARKLTSNRSKFYLSE
jgi:hypothetical protein